ncbi:MAG TPA: UrcA family protein [Rhizomicrobium sp.]
MHKHSTIRMGLGSGLCALAFGVAMPVFAQGYDVNETPYSAGPNETVTVIAPRFHADSTPLNGPLEKISLSQPIHYRTGDLLTPRGARALRRRVWYTAAEVCGRLAEAYPVYTSTTSPHCFREAYSTAMAKIDARITGARLAYYGSYYGY